MLICRDCIEIKSSHFIPLPYEKGVTMTPKRLLLTLIFACFICFKKSLLIKVILIVISPRLPRRGG